MTLLLHKLKVLRRLENEGVLVLYHDYRSKSLQDFSGNNNNVSTVVSGFWDGSGIREAGLVVADNSSTRLTEGCLMVLGTFFPTTNSQKLTTKRGAALTNYEFQLSDTTTDLGFYDGFNTRVATFSSIAGRHVLAVNFEDGETPDFYVDVDKVAGDDSVSVSEQSEDVEIGGYNGGSGSKDNVFEAALIFNRQLTDSEIYQVGAEIRSLRFPTKRTSKSIISLPTDADDSSLVFSSDMKLVNSKIIDVSDNANGAVKGGANLFSKKTILGDALRFNEGEWLDLDTNIVMSSGDYTVVAWLIPEDVAVKGEIVGNYWFMYDTNNKLTHYTGSDYRDSNNSLVWGKVHHVAQTIAADGTLRYYIDGELDTSAFDDADTSIVAAAIGNHDASSTSFASDMTLADIKVYSEVKSAAWIKNQYMKGARAIQFQTGYGIEESVANVTSGSIGGSDIKISTGEWQVVNDSIGGLTNGTELLGDGDCEDAGTSYFAASNATLTKELGSRDGGNGDRILRITYDGGSPYALPRNSDFNYPCTIGKKYRITGWCRGDGTAYPRIYGPSSAYVWGGTPSTDWQYFDVAAVATITSFRLYAYGAGVGNYCDYDDVSIQEVVNNVKALECKVAGIAYIPVDNFMSPTDAAYGTWEFYISKDDTANIADIMLIADTIGGAEEGSQNGYGIRFDDDETIALIESVAGSATDKIASSTQSLDTWYKITVTRNFEGKFALFIDDSLIDVATDSTSTTSNYLALDFDAGDKISLGSKEGEYSIRKRLGA